MITRKWENDKLIHLRSNTFYWGMLWFSLLSGGALFIGVNLKDMTLVSTLLLVLSLVFFIFFLGKLFPDVILFKNSSELLYQRTFLPFLYKKIIPSSDVKVLIVEGKKTKEYSNVSDDSDIVEYKDFWIEITQGKSNEVILMNRLTKRLMFDKKLIKHEKKELKRIFEEHGYRVFIK